MKIQNGFYLSVETTTRLSKIAKDQDVKLSDIAEYAIKNLCNVLEDTRYSFDIKLIIERDISE